MLNGSESPSSDAACSSSLASILEPLVPSRYYHSARGAAGILWRAPLRGKTLPVLTDMALRMTVVQNRKEDEFQESAEFIPPTT
jgi:hypothetical protein